MSHPREGEDHPSAYYGSWLVYICFLSLMGSPNLKCRIGLQIKGSHELARLASPQESIEGIVKRQIQESRQMV